MSKTAIILGASGLVGGEVVKQLLADFEGNPLHKTDFEKIKIFVRKPISISHNKLEQIVVDFSSIGTYSELISGDVIFCCMGTTIKNAGSQDSFIKVDYTYPLEFAKIAKENGIKKMLLISSIGADKAASNFYLKVKGDIELAIEKLKFDSFIILRPSMLLGNRKEVRFGESVGKVFMKLFSFLFIGKFKKYKAIEASVVAKAMVKLSKLELSGTKIFHSDGLQQLGKDE
jgi:uncharacterized protein YbjT (DUF2867 family)